MCSCGPANSATLSTASYAIHPSNLPKCCGLPSWGRSGRPISPSGLSTGAPSRPSLTITTTDGHPCHCWEATCAHVRSPLPDLPGPTPVHPRFPGDGAGVEVGVNRKSHVDCVPTPAKVTPVEASSPPSAACAPPPPPVHPGSSPEFLRFRLPPGLLGLVRGGDMSPLSSLPSNGDSETSTGGG